MPLRRRVTSSGAVSSAKLVKLRTSAQRTAAAIRLTESRCTCPALTRSAGAVLPLIASASVPDNSSIAASSRALQPLPRPTVVEVVHDKTTPNGFVAGCAVCTENLVRF
jgi:hypothetical protein